MTEAEWLGSTDIYNMLEYLREKVSDRRFRLFAVACCNRPYFRIADDRHQKAVALAERMADENVDEEEWRAIHQAAYELWKTAWDTSLAAQQKAPRGTQEVESLVDNDMATAAAWAILEDAWEGAYQVTGVEWDEKHADEPSYQLALLRCVFGNPIRPTTVNPVYFTPRVVALAQQIYDDRAFDRLPMLADALEEAGCTNADILAHCRQSGQHVRG